MEKEQQKGHCPMCEISDETIKNLKNGQSPREDEKEGYESKKIVKEKERAGRGRQRKIKKIIFAAIPLILIAGGIVFAAFSYKPPIAQGQKITVFLSPTCGCCHQYVDYLKAQGFQVEEKETNDMLAIKEQYNVPENMEACHTSVVDGYFIEGHVPVEAIKKLLQERPKIDGIALPGMPEGAPGMGGVSRGGFKIYQLSGGNASEFFSF